ncbi:galactose-3-O-sulfotransferase 2-like [Mercenaria mercenaria]|uniref:galactose-3-O-sulfotransferase 2-like n=1 Tax=Mercenaria mercenaria TaxID=6596 RepID=UPI00234E6EBD|nr:galactose-3-O-sulfotransferase 2-like [Mercenaria mercenaria]
MIKKPMGDGIPKWLMISTLFVVVCALAVIETLLPLHTSTSIPPPRQYSVNKSSSHNSNRKYIGSIVQKDLLQITPKSSTKGKRRKVTHIGFLKVYKAGSSTLANIFFRFGINHNLTFVLPTKGYQFMGTNYSAMPVKPGQHRDILACHSVYSRIFFGSVLPEDSVKIGIIREPSERMVSAAYYYRDVWKRKYLLKVPKLNFIHNLVERPDLYETKPFSETKNAMGHVFGFSPSITVNDTEAIEKHLDLLKKDFKQVLVMERFEESLILMKRTLNWDLADVIYLKRNSHAHQPVIFGPDELKKFKNTCFLDYAVYETFYEIFDKKIDAEGPDFINEVEHFNSVLQSVRDFCKLGSMNPPQISLRISQSVWNEPFEVTKQDCHYMKMGAFKLMDFLKERHREMNMNHDIVSR